MIDTKFSLLRKDTALIIIAFYVNYSPGFLYASIGSYRTHKVFIDLQVLLGCRRESSTYSSIADPSYFIRIPTFGSMVRIVSLAFSVETWGLGSSSFRQQTLEYPSGLVAFRKIETEGLLLSGFPMIPRYWLGCTLTTWMGTPTVLSPSAQGWLLVVDIREYGRMLLHLNAGDTVQIGYDLSGGISLRWRV